jgi:hypothetical protein
MSRIDLNNRLQCALMSCCGTALFGRGGNARPVLVQSASDHCRPPAGGRS